MKTTNVTLYWFRRDLRLEDNAGLYHALKENKNILPVFIFDKDILQHLKPNDRRVSFIYDQIMQLKSQLEKHQSDLYVGYDVPLDFFKKITKMYHVTAIYTNHDYEPLAIKRDSDIQRFCDKNQIEFKTFKDHVIFEKSEILTDSKKPYTVYTPYKKKWLAALKPFYLKPYPTQKYFKNLFKFSAPLKIDLKPTKVEYPPLKISKALIKDYQNTRDIPSLEHGTSRLGLHLRFGTVSIRKLAQLGLENSAVWLSELIWRDFFIQVLWHSPHSENESFRPLYDRIQWRNVSKELDLWKNGQTGFPMVDAGMRELNATGFMHNRVRMVTASFLTKHLLHYWKLGERYFAEQLYDYDLAANVGNWQWAAGTGCDAAPYFRVFNPDAQQKRFDPEFKYIKKWVPEWGTVKYVKPMVGHVEARKRAIETYKEGLKPS